MTRRRMFEPSGWLDRIVYAALALTGPQAAIVSLRNPDLLVAAIIMGTWSIIAAFYTIEWAILSYRKWRTKA
jgi:hypothetical protein